MEITASAISLNVDDVAASAAFVIDNFGFKEDSQPMALCRSLGLMRGLT